jgi:hypothetical protein
VLRHEDPVDEMEEGLPTDFELTKRKRLRLSKSLLLRMRGILLSNVRRIMIAFGPLEVMGDGGKQIVVMGPDFQR